MAVTQRQTGVLLALALATTASACINKSRQDAPATKSTPTSDLPLTELPIQEADETAPVAKLPMSAAETEALSMPLSALPFPKLSRNAAGEALIRVKVFPHFSGKDTERIDKVAIAGDCDIFPGKKQRAAPDGAKARATTRLELTPATLPKPLWISCNEATVERNPPLESYRYNGSFYARTRRGPESDNRPYIEIVNVIPMEHYLRGVVPVEIGQSWPKESLKAQAVAARTYAYFNIAYKKKSKDTEVFDVDDTPAFQAYSGITNAAATTDKAIADTAGVVMQIKNKVILTFFHADSGGYTASAAEIFGLNAPYCLPKREPEGLSKPATWKASVAISDLARRLGSKVIPTGKSITAVTIDARTVSGRVRNVKLTLQDGTSAIVGSMDFKKAAGGLASSLFDFGPITKGRLKIRGHGLGHGVGLSQRSARDMATRGWTYEKILTFFYTGATPVRLK